MKKNRFILKSDDTALLVIDIQEKLFSAMIPEVQALLVKNAGMLIEISKLLRIPIIVTEQYRKGLGPTISELKGKVDGSEAFDKLFFDCTKDPRILNEIEKCGRKNIILTGIESHICIFQTSVSLCGMGLNVAIASDAVGSRKKHDWKMSLGAMSQAGALIYPAETISFMLLEKSGTEEFRKASHLFR